MSRLSQVSFLAKYSCTPQLRLRIWRIKSVLYRSFASKWGWLKTMPKLAATTFSAGDWRPTFLQWPLLLPWVCWADPPITYSEVLYQRHLEGCFWKERCWKRLASTIVLCIITDTSSVIILGCKSKVHQVGMTSWSGQSQEVLLVLSLLPILLTTSRFWTSIVLRLSCSTWCFH